MHGLIEDCRHAFRLYRQTAGSSLIAIGVLAIGIAFVSAFVSLYVDLVLRPHPGFDDSHRLVTLTQSTGQDFFGPPADLIEVMADETASLESVVGVMSNYRRRDGEPVEVDLVTRGFFDGIRPRLQSGRGFERAEHEADAEPVTVISYRYWQDELEGRVDILDTTLSLRLDFRLDDAPEEATKYRIVGIMSPDMTGLGQRPTDLWFPLERVYSMDRIASMMTIARRSPDASELAVEAELEGRYRDTRGIEAGARFDVIEGIGGSVFARREAKAQLQLFLAASVLLAVVAAANVSLLLLSRAPGRRRELGIRLAVGAPLRRLGRQLVSEAAMLVAVSLVLGLVLSVWLGNALQGLAFLQAAEWRNVTLLDWRVFALVGTVLALLTLLVSLGPVLGLRRIGIAQAGQQVTSRATIGQRAAGFLQLAIAGTLGGVAIAFAWHLGLLVFGKPGYETRDRFVAEFSVNATMNDFPTFQAYFDFAIAQANEMPRRRTEIEAIPGVVNVSFCDPVPGQMAGSFINVPDPFDPMVPIRVTLGSLDERYIDVLGLRLIHGRAPEAGENAVAVINRTLAERYYGREDVAGEPIRTSTRENAPSYPVIGVVDEFSFGHPADNPEPVLMMAGDSSLNSKVVIESSMTAAALQQELDRIIAEGGLELSVRSLRPLAALRFDHIGPDRARGLLTIGAATLVVLLAAFGFYGTQRYLVSAGRREYAIRASLGAGPTALGRLVLLRGIGMSLPGLLLGAFLTFIGVSLIRDDYLSSAISPGVVTALVVAGLVLLLLAASLGPARQARRTQPAPLLRED